MAGLPAATIGEIARRSGQPVHKVAYAIRSRGIEPTQRAGNCRIFDESAVEQIIATLKRIEADREASHGF